MTAGKSAEARRTAIAEWRGRHRSWLVIHRRKRSRASFHSNEAMHHTARTEKCEKKGRVRPTPGILRRFGARSSPSAAPAAAEPAAFRLLSIGLRRKSAVLVVDTKRCRTRHDKLVLTRLSLCNGCCGVGSRNKQRVGGLAPVETRSVIVLAGAKNDTTFPALTGPSDNRD